MPHILPFSPDLLDSHLPVDVRTPLEFEEDHLPGAVNVPLLSNEERVEIGTLYKQTGPYAARMRGLQLTAPRFPAMVEEIAAAAEGRPILVYCWRGGLRSRTVREILDLTGHDAFQMEGGYKAFRNWIIAYFTDFRPPGPLVVIHGMTGVGKTTFLLGLHEETGAVIDLEGLARHRGSAFGALGLNQDELSQKRFDTLLWDSFRRVAPGRPVLLEGESRRIGRITLPGNLYEVMHQSVKIWCEASLDTRVGRLVAEYGREEFRQGMAEALGRIRKKLGGDTYAEIAGYLERWELEPFMRTLMERYYDRVYYKTLEWSPEAVISLEDYRQGEADLRSFLQQRLP